MPISDKDREDHARGERDRDLGVFDRALNDIPANHPDTDSYYKGRRDEPLDGDKKHK